MCFHRSPLKAFTYKNAFKIDDFLMTRRYDDARESKIQLIQHLKESNLLFTISINDYNPAIIQINKDVICLICKSIKEVLRSKNLDKVDLQALLAFNMVNLF